MNVENLRKEFGNAQLAKVFYTQLNALLMTNHGFTPKNTRFAEGQCCDEINEPELEALEATWGERFKLGGLAGYPHGGKPALGAVSHHVPNLSGVENLLVVAGPHIGYHEGTWGIVEQHGLDHGRGSCGSLKGVLGTDKLSVYDRKGLIAHALHGYIVEHGPITEANVNQAAERAYAAACVMGMEQQTLVGELSLSYLQGESSPSLVGLTKHFASVVDTDLRKMVQEGLNDFTGRIALVTGVTINTSEGNYFAATNLYLRDEKGSFSPLKK